VLAHPELRTRSFAVFSFGKTLHATGWRVGYCAAPRALTTELRKVHQFNTFSVVHPLQHAIAAYIAANPESWQGLSAFFQKKRDLLRDALAGTPFDLPPAEGTYFQLLGYERLADEDDLAFADRLITEGGLATIPLSPFYRDPPSLRYVRLCIAKQDSTLRDAAARLIQFAEKVGR
jgi:methionine transaminase